MSPGAQSMGLMCSLLIKKVVQSTEPEAHAVYESGRSWVVWTRNPGHKIYSTSSFPADLLLFPMSQI